MKANNIQSPMMLGEKASFLSGADMWHTRAIERLNIPAITLSDGPSGLRKQAGEGDHLGLNASTKATCIPSAATYANSWDESVAQKLGAVVGKDARAQNVQVLLGPGLNTKRSSLCGRSFEYYSEDPYLAGKMAAGFIRGVQEQGVAACAKHFAANSQEMLRMSSDSVMDERTLRELYLTNFEIAVKEGKPKAIMTSYNRLNGTYTNENEHLLKDILRGEWNWQGLVDVEQHKDALEAAEKSVVLLKNEGNLLPLRKDAKVAVIGDFADKPRYQGAGSSMVNAERVESTMALLPGYFPKNVGYAQGFERQDKPNAELAAQAIALAKNAECVLMYIGLPESFETEGLDRTHMRLPGS